MQQPTEKRRWHNDWRWGLAGCLGLGVVSAAAIGLMVFLVLASLKSSDVHQEALARAQSS